MTRPDRGTTDEGAEVLEVIAENGRPNVLGELAMNARWTSSKSTWIEVRQKAFDRVSKNKPVSLARDDLIAIALTLKKLGTLVAIRRGDQSAWLKHRDEIVFGDHTVGASQADGPANAYGLVLDALEHRFSPNLGTRTFLRLARFIDDPGSTNDYWTEIFRKRHIRTSLTTLRVPDPSYGWEPPYDDALDSLLRQRGWHSRASEERDDHAFDCWTYGPVDRIRKLPFPWSGQVEMELTYLQCTGSGTYEIARPDRLSQGFASRRRLLRVLHVIEELSWVPTERELRP
jgi:hypothetical protein